MDGGRPNSQCGTLSWWRWATCCNGARVFFSAERKGINGYLDSEKCRHKQDLTPSTVASITPELAASIVVPSVFLVLPLNARTTATVVSAPIVSSRRVPLSSLSLCTSRSLCPCSSRSLSLCSLSLSLSLRYPSLTHAPCHDVRRLRACSFVRGHRSLLVVEKKRNKASSREC